MPLSDILMVFLGRVGAVLLLVALPLLASAAGLAALRRADTIAYRSVPILPGLCVLAGVLAGLLLLAANAEPGLFGGRSLFAADGPWSLSVTEFLTERLDPARYAPQALFHDIADQADTEVPRVFALAAAVLLALATGGALGRWSSGAALRAIAFNALVFLWWTGLAIYAACLLAWLINKLNFWLIVIAFVVFHRLRQS